MERWIRRTAGVPRGLLRFLVLKYLSRKPMSGTEIVAIIERETSGKWKPSPGSIYPLLARLQNKGYSTESFSLEDGMKRYVLTEKGKQFFEEQVKLGQNFLEKLEWLAPMLVEGFHFGTNHERFLCARESAKRLLKTFMEVQAKQDNLSKADIQEIETILDDSNRQLKEIPQRIKEEKPD